MRTRSVILHITVVMCLSSMGGCGDDLTGPQGMNVAGRWTGSAIQPNGYSATVNLQQAGTAVSGDLTIAGSMRDQPLIGTLDARSRTVAWTVADGCEVWGGTLALSADDTELSGPLVIDRSGCASQSGSGTLRVSRR